MWGNFWKGVLGFGVISGILSTWDATKTQANEFWAAVWGYILHLWAFLTTPFISLVHLIVILLGFAVLFLMLKISSRTPQRMNELLAADILWRWNWSGNSILRNSISPYCPHCKRPLYFKDLSSYAAARGSSTIYICRHCADFGEKIIHEDVQETKKWVGNEAVALMNEA